MSTGHVPDDASIPEPAVEEVSDGIYAYIQLDGSWGLNNTGFVVGGGGVLVVDSCFTERRTKAFIEAIRKVTSLPMRTLVNTHNHGDHTHGNYLLPNTAIIAHELCREAIVSAGLSTPASGVFGDVDWGDLQLAPPFVTFQDRINIYAGDLKIEVIFVGPAHTDNDVILWIPERKLLFSGDVIFNGGTPFVIAGSVAGSLTALDFIRSLDAELIVPGHGSVCGPEAIDEQVAYLRFIQEIARKGFEAELTPLEAAKSADLGRFDGWHDKERIAGNLHRAYSELRGEPLGAPIERASMFAEMVAYNDGKPLRCIA